MKHLILSLMIMAFVASTSAQVQFGLKAGANYSGLRGTWVTDAYDYRLGFNAGVFLELPVASRFSVKPEVVYSLQGPDVSRQGVADGKMSYHYINIPVLAKYNIVHGLFLETGPQLGLLASTRFKERSTGIFNGPPLVRKTDFSWAFGAGYEFRNGFGINGRYNLGLNTTSPNKDIQQNNSVFQFGIFYKFRR